jgi:hypothetical protein
VRSRAVNKAAGYPVCSNHSNMFSDLRFMIQYACSCVMVVAGDQENAAERSQAVRSRAIVRSPASLNAPRRLATSGACSNHSNIPFDIWFMFRYALVIAVVVLLPRTREKAAAAERSRAVLKVTHRHLFRMLKSFRYAFRSLLHVRVCSNRSDMPSDLCFMFGYAQIIQICLPIFASCSGMPLLSWFLCCCPRPRRLQSGAGQSASVALIPQGNSSPPLQYAQIIQYALRTLFHAGVCLCRVVVGAVATFRGEGERMASPSLLRGVRSALSGKERMISQCFEVNACLPALQQGACNFGHSGGESWVTE